MDNSCILYPIELWVQAFPTQSAYLALLSEKQVVSALRLLGLSQISYVFQAFLFIVLRMA